VAAAIDNQLRRVNSGMFTLRCVPAGISRSVPSCTSQIALNLLPGIITSFAGAPQTGGRIFLLMALGVEK
jgi:hypothetical protein